MNWDSLWHTTSPPDGHESGIMFGWVCSMFCCVFPFLVLIIWFAIRQGQTIYRLHWQNQKKGENTESTEAVDNPPESFL